jgi:hypothetical protein
LGPGDATPNSAGFLLALLFVLLFALFACPRAQAEDPAPVTPPTVSTPTKVGVDITGVAGIAHDVRSGWKKPILFSVVTAVGPHYGPVYVGGAGSYQGTDGVGVAVPFVTYVIQGKLHGLFRGVALQVGVRKRDGFTGPTAYYFMVGGSR